MSKINKMPKAVILAGGFGTRISEESHLRPKPMIELGGKPIIWHIMKLFYHYGVKEFIILAGYKQQVIKEYFSNYFLHNCDITYDFSDGKMTQIIHSHHMEGWKVTVVDTGLNTMTGGRIKRVADFLNDGEPFFLTYGDGVSNVNIRELLDFHMQHGRKATITGFIPEGRFGIIDLKDDNVTSFREKMSENNNWINIGYMVLEKNILNYIEDDSTPLEQEPMKRLANEGNLMCYRHKGFWKCMDTLRDKEALEKIYAEGDAPWVVW